MFGKCAEYEKLAVEVNNVLAQLTELTTAQREAFGALNHEEFRRIDHELENVMGAKERAIGALRQHVKDHKCQPGPYDPPLA